MLISLEQVLLIRLPRERNKPVSNLNTNPGSRWFDEIYALAQPTGLTATISAQTITPQTITFNDDLYQNLAYGSSVTLTATASSGLTVGVSSDEINATVSGKCRDGLLVLELQPSLLHKVVMVRMTQRQHNLQTITVGTKGLRFPVLRQQQSIRYGNDASVIIGTLSRCPLGTRCRWVYRCWFFATTDVANGIEVATSVVPYRSWYEDKYVLWRVGGRYAKTLTVTDFNSSQ